MICFLGLLCLLVIVAPPCLRSTIGPWSSTFCWWQIFFAQSLSVNLMLVICVNYLANSAHADTPLQPDEPLRLVLVHEIENLWAFISIWTPCNLYLNWSKCVLPVPPSSCPTSSWSSKSQHLQGWVSHQQKHNEDHLWRGRFHIRRQWQHDPSGCW